MGKEKDLKNRITTLADLEKIKQESLKRMAVRLQDPAEKGLPGDTPFHIMFCFGTCCLSSGAAFVRRPSRKALKKTVLLIRSPW